MVFVHQTDMENLSEVCPPRGAVRGSVSPVYRFFDNDTINENGFKSHKQLGIKYPLSKECEALAISFFTTEEAAQKMAHRYPKFKSKKLISGRITPECGVYNINNGTKHLNLWVYRDVNIANIFQGNEEKNDGIL